MLREKQRHIEILFVYVDRNRVCPDFFPHTICHEKSLNIPDPFSPPKFRSNRLTNWKCEHEGMKVSTHCFG